ncbi:MAG: chemotaxis protein CheB [Saprospiraceae bacterium]
MMDRTDQPRTKSADKNPFLLVGVGASAGGVQALQRLFLSIPADSNMAYVVVMHLSEQYESNLDSILQNQTQMPVQQVQEPVLVEPNHVYVIPPGKFLEMMDGMIRLREPERVEGKRISIDHFFRTLADTYGRRAVCIILSGTGTDGTLGMKHIKERNGFAMVQDPATAAFDMMPRSAINTGLVDVVLPIEQIVEKLIFVRDSTEQFQLTEEDDEAIVTQIKGSDALREIITFLRLRTGNDFSSYKQPTILRRIARHLQIHELDNIHDYLNLLRERPNEVELLLHNLLINVTNFFRDKAAFEALEDIVIPALFKDKSEQDVVRVWVPGCASGEEAYSIAILLVEYAEKLSNPPKIQIFASDVDEDAIAEARQGRYMKSISLDVSEERLRRFFVKEGEDYRIHKEIRKLVLFAPHNILRDPPFSRLDLVSCRNVFIYLNRPTQEKVLQLFHFALRKGGFLFLGTSESAEGNPLLFTLIDKKHRIYRCHEMETAPQLPLKLPMIGNSQVKPQLEVPQINREKIFSFGEFHHRLVEQYAPPSVLVNEEFDIVHLSENAGRYLHFAGGEPSNNLLKVLHPDLQLALRGALFAAKSENRMTKVPDVRVQLEGQERFVTITVHTVNTPDSDPLRGFLLVLFEEYTFPIGEEAQETSKERHQREMHSSEGVVHRLEEELERTKERLRSTIEQYETSLEELKASNEELQVINEELRSATEELETSKEEMQSVNEELTTVNNELKETLEEVSHANADLQNLMYSTQIATIFLDRALNIKRFTPDAQKLFNVLNSDVGRPISHLTHMLEYEQLQEDAQKVLKTLQTVEREIHGVDGNIYIVRLLPYRTLDDRIDGVAVTFLAITERARAEAALRESEEKYRSIFESIDEGFTIQELITDENNDVIDIIYREANDAFEQHTGIKNIVGKKASELFPHLEQHWLDNMSHVYKTGEPVRMEGYQADLDRWITLQYSRVGGPGSRLISVVFQDITERKQRDQRQEFLLKFSDALRSEPDIKAIEETGLQLLAEALRLDRAYTFMLYPAEDRAVVRAEKRAEHLFSLVGEVRMSDFPETVRQIEDETLVINDINSDERLSDLNRASLNAVNLQAFVCASVRKGEGNVIWSLAAATVTARTWTSGEIELIETVAERLWAAVERAKAEEALRESQERLRIALEAAGLATWDWDLQTQQVHWNEQHFLLFELEPQPEPVPTALFFKYVHPEDRANVESILQKSVEGQAAFDTAFRVVLKDNTIRWMNGYGRVIDSKDGVAIRMAGVMFDITERKEAEIALRESKARLQRAIDIETVGVIFFTVDGEITYANDAFLRMSGYNRADLEKGLLRWDDMTPDEWMPASVKAIDEFMKFGRTTPYEKEYIRKDGTRWWALFAATRLNNGEGVEFIVDITERKQAEEAVRESEERLHLILESVEDYAIFTTDLNGTITRWNAGAVQVFGYTQTEAVGQSIDITFTPEDVTGGIPAQERERALETGRAINERWHLKKDGTRFFASGVTTLLRDSYVHGFVKIARDLTFQKKVEEALIDADRKKNEFLATLAHELRNPLTPIRAALEVINKSDDREKEQQAREVIERQMRKIVILVDDLLEISRISRGKIKLEKELIPLQEAVRDALEMTDPLMKAAKHQFKLQQPDEPIYLYADCDRIAQVIVNILGNAIKYTNSGGEIALNVAAEDGEAIIRVKDNGVGIPPDRLESIFELFNQVEQSGKKFQTGLGIGLSLVKNLVEMHGGTISAYSEGEGKGSEFIMRLPLAPTSMEEAVSADAATEKSNKATESIRILVVEDDVDIAEMLKAVLELEGHQVRYTHTGMDAIKAVQLFDPHAALIDIGLPDIDGYEVAQTLRQQYPHLLLIAHSGWGAAEDRQRSKAAGFDYHLVKPAETEEILELLPKGNE